jgi:hypothetical protein
VGIISTMTATLTVHCVLVAKLLTRAEHDHRVRTGSGSVRAEINTKQLARNMAAVASRLWEVATQITAGLVTSD